MSKIMDEDTGSRTYCLTLHIPFFTVVFRLMGREIDIANLQRQLQADIPELSSKINKYRISVFIFSIEVARIGALLRRLERTWLTIDERLTPKAYKVDALVTVARRFQIDKREVK